MGFCFKREKNVKSRIITGNDIIKARVIVYNNKTASLVEASILASIAIVFAAISLYFPILGTFANIVWPVPIILLGVRHGLKWSFWCLVVAGVLIAVIISPLQSFALVVGLGLIGLTLGWALHSGKSALKALAFGSIASILSKLLIVAFSFFVMGVNPVNFSPENIALMIEEAIVFYRSLGMTEEMLEQIRQQLQTMLSMTQVLLPTGFVFGSLLDTFVNFLVAKAILKRLGTHVSDITPFKNWVMPNLVLILYGVSLLIINFNQAEPQSIWYQAGINLNFLAGMPLLVQGISIFWHYSAQKEWPGIFKVLFIGGLFLGPIIPFATLMVGMFDFVFDFRKIRPKRQP